MAALIDERPGPLGTTAPIEYELPLSGCMLRVHDGQGGGRTGELFASSGRRLDLARCAAAGHITGWYGRDLRSGRSWALAFGAGGAHEVLEVGFAGVYARRSTRVTSDQHGLWVAEVSGSFRAATVLTGTAVRTLRLHRV